MNNKRTGAILLGAAGLTAAIGMAGVQISKAIVLAGFYAGQKSGVVPLGPEAATLDKIVLWAVIILAVAGVFFLLRKSKEA
jgi:hypothetical protein